MDWLNNITVGEIIAALAGLAAIVTLALKWQSWIAPILRRWKERREMVKAHESRLNKIDENIELIKGDVKKLTDDVERNASDSREYRRTSLSDKIFRKYQEYTRNGFVTKDQIENFYVCVERYRKCVEEDCKERDLVLNIYVPRVLELPINAKGGN